MTLVKICGIKREEDAVAACLFGADMIGFIFYSKSPRFCPPDAAAAICGEVPAHVTKVGVFVDAPEDEVRGTAALCGLDALQFSGGEGPDYIGRFAGRWKVIKAFRVKDALPTESEMEASGADYYLLDAYSRTDFGGTGRRFAWRSLSGLRRPENIIVAGGLTPENVGELLEIVRPFAVDVSSGVELAPGVKDHEKMRAFIKAVKGEIDAS